MERRLSLTVRKPQCRADLLCPGGPDGARLDSRSAPRTPPQRRVAPTARATPLGQSYIATGAADSAPVGVVEPVGRSYAAAVQRARVIAIDWSGRSGPDQKRALWLGEAQAGELVRLESERTRDQLVDLLVAEAARDSNLVVGLDFAFSLPAWFLHERALDARQLWAALAEESLTPRMRLVGLASWMNNPEPPFWTTRDGHVRLAAEQRRRKTETEVRAPGVQPKSVFQLVGAGQVGRGSLYGMQALHRLAAAGFRIWPFEPAIPPTVIEIFPRLLTGAVRKSSPRARADYLATLAMPTDLRQLAGASEDAFDAAVSTLVMAAADELTGLAAEDTYSLEGKIWQPGARIVLTRSTYHQPLEAAEPPLASHHSPETPRRANATAAGEKLDLDAARAFVASIPEGRWASYGDVALAAGASKGAQAIASWITHSAGDVPRVYRVLNRHGEVSAGWKPVAPDLPTTPEDVRAKWSGKA